MEFNAFVSATLPRVQDFGDGIYEGMPSGHHIEVVTPPARVALDFTNAPGGWVADCPAIPDITNDGIEDGFQFRFTDGVNHGDTQTAILWLLLGE